MLRIIKIFGAAVVVALAVLGCGKPERGDLQVAASVSPFASFRDVPGVTPEEIAAIEALQRERESFIYGMMVSTEAFQDQVGDSGDYVVKGYVALFCQWLTGLFGIPFIPAIYDWIDILPGLRSYSIDFNGDYTPTEDRRKTWFMTDGIAEHMVKYMRLAGGTDLSLIRKTRLPRFGFLEGSNTPVEVASRSAFPFDAVTVKDSSEAYAMLKSDEIDAFIEDGFMEAAFDAFGEVVTEAFYPLIFNVVAMTTMNPKLEPVISVVTKALRNGAIHHLNYLYDQGYEEYKITKFHSQLSKEEREFLRNPSPVPMVSRYYNYPVGFYNTHEDEWQGIAFDVLAEVSKFTGLTFQVVNNKNTEIAALVEMLDNGQAHIMPDIPFSESLEDRALWARNNFLSNQYALLSKTDFPNISLNEIANARIGLIAITIPTEMFRKWFPSASNTREYDSDGSAFRALENGEIDLLMSTKNRLLSIINYYELPNYKANYLFNSYESSFAFNRNQRVLCSIIDMVLPLIDTNTIVEQWMTKTYDYRAKVAEGRLPWFIGAAVLSLIVLAMILIQFIRGLGARKRLAMLVAEETSTISAILDGTPDHLFCKDLKRRYTRCNKNMADFHNFPMDKIIGKDDVEAFNLPLESSTQLKVIEQKVLDEKQTHICDEIVPTPNGTMLLFETIRAPLVVNGKVTGLVGMARDITRRKAAEDEAKKASAEAMKAYAEAEMASEAKSRFLANMSHEMRTPMNVIVGLTDLMLEEDNISEKVKEELKKINTAGTTLTGLINDILDISKIEAGKQELNPAEYDVASFLNDIITLNIVRIGEKPITFKLDISDNVPKKLFGDDLRVKQVLNNFLSNAFKYTEQGTVTLGVTASRIENFTTEDTENTEKIEKSIKTPSCPQGQHSSVVDYLITFSISDTGMGIREEDIKKLFSDYNQVDTKANRKIEGTGLGLSITKKFVEMMDGEITVESEYGKGTTFRARIRQGFVTDTPIAKETVENLRSLRYTDKKKQAQGKIVRPDLSYVRVLVVDDFPMNLDVAAGMLRKYKMQVDCASSGQEAVDRIKAGDPVYNAVFMDHMMPGMDGVEATKLIRGLGTEYAEKLPVIALTANAVAGSEQMFLENGFNAFLPKPFNAPLLDSVIKKWIVSNEK